MVCQKQARRHGIRFILYFVYMSQGHHEKTMPRAWSHRTKDDRPQTALLHQVEYGTCSINAGFFFYASVVVVMLVMCRLQLREVTPYTSLQET